MDIPDNIRNRSHLGTQEVSDEIGNGNLVAGDFSIDKTLWDAALASADDALSLVQWLESKRTD